MTNRQALLINRREDVREPTGQLSDERRHQSRVPLRLRANRARRWVAGAWRDLEAVVVDLSDRGVGLSLDREVRLGDRLSMAIPLTDGAPELRVMIEIRHMRDAGTDGQWRAGGPFRNLSSADHERVARFIFTALRSRER